MATEEQMKRAQRLLNVLPEKLAAEVLADEWNNAEDAVYAVICGRILNKSAEEFKNQESSV